MPIAESDPIPEPEQVAFEAAPEPEPEPEPPALVVVPAPDPEAEPQPQATAAPEANHVSEFDTTELPALPDYVIDEPDEIAPVAFPEPEPEPDLSGPLPEFVVEPSAAPEPPPARVESLLEPEEEEDLGPLPDYVVDPSNPQPRPAPPPPPPPVFEAPVATRDVKETPSEAAGLYFPPVTAFPTPRADRDDDEPRERRRAPRRKPPAEPKPSKHSTEPAEPGDEGGGEVDWMEGLSNRLSAYSLSEDEARAAADTDDDEKD